jgi:5-methyltetrahydropteroyltriglutamate--homocysteine methyltransferase
VSAPLLITHTGSLPRPDTVLDLLVKEEQGEEIDQQRGAALLGRAVREVVSRQQAIGLDVINDGEMSKISYATYVRHRLTGFGSNGDPFQEKERAPDLSKYPCYQQRWREQHGGAAQIRRPCCTAPITYCGTSVLQFDLAHLQEAIAPLPSPPQAFVTAASPGLIAWFLRDRYYGRSEAYVAALADAMREEYRAIVAAGFLLQLDCPDLTVMARLQQEAQGPDLVSLHIEALNYATRDIAPERMRLHVCWGNYEGPHDTDVPLRDLIQRLLLARPVALLFAAANPRHEQEWQVFEEVKLPEDKILIPGVIDTTTNYIEHPDLVAERLLRFARLVGRERLIAGTDCGFASHAQMQPVEASIVWAKLAALVEGTRRASARLRRIA